MFADKVEIEVKAGKGGDGLTSFRHEKFRARGGPDGGNGGDGGDVVFQVDHNLNTLIHLKRNPVIRAKAGSPGGKNRRHGKSGEDTIIKVPVGTMVFEAGVSVVDLTRDQQVSVMARGGRGGFGNAHFTSATRQTPRVAELGQPGEVKKLTVELKLVADVGLVGLPNSGKSTLLSIISNARPEIADYPFTTVVPNLGVVDFEGFTFLAADIPGLIEGASRGKGLGDEFLRHIERTVVLLHLIDATESDAASAWRTIKRELAEYAIDLSRKPQIAVLTKIDAVPPHELKNKKIQLERIIKDKVYPISAVAHRGLEPLLRAAIKQVKLARLARKKAAQSPPVIDVTHFKDLWQVNKKGTVFTVSGVKIERFAAQTDFGSPEGAARLRDILGKLGIAKELSRLGIKSGQMVRIGSKELVW